MGLFTEEHLAGHLHAPSVGCLPGHCQFCRRGRRVGSGALRGSRAGRGSAIGQHDYLRGRAGAQWDLNSEKPVRVTKCLRQSKCHNKSFSLRAGILQCLLSLLDVKPSSFIERDPGAWTEGRTGDRTWVPKSSPLSRMRHH